MSQDNATPSPAEAMEMAGMFQPVESTVAPTADPTPAAALEVPTLTEATPDAPADPPADPADKRMAALMAKEAEVLAKQQELRNAEPAMAERIRKQVLAELTEQFQLSPKETIRSFAPDRKASDVGIDLWYEENPDKAPAEWKAERAERVAALHAAKNAQLRADHEAETKRQSELKAQQEAEEAERTYRTSLQEYLPAVPDSYGRVKSLASSKPEVATGMMLDAARRIAQQAEAEKWSPDQFAAAIDPGAIAKSVEQYLEYIGYAVPAAATQPNASAAQSSAPTSLRNTHSAAQAGRAPLDPNDERVRVRNALAEAGLPLDLMDPYLSR
jgi:hypothetical protein